MRPATILGVIALGVFGLTVLGGINEWSRQSQPPSVKTPEQIRAEGYDVAIHGCENWTRTHGKLGMGEIVDEYRIAGKDREKDYFVGFRYRAQGSGLLMYSHCRYTPDFALVSATTDLKR